jgi:hypothetical protein
MLEQQFELFCCKCRRLQNLRINFIGNGILGTRRILQGYGADQQEKLLGPG